MTDQRQPVPDIETGWTNPPTLGDLQGDFNSVQSHHQQQVAKIENWIAKLRPESVSPTQSTTNSSPFAAQYTTKVKTRSQVKSKLIRKNAEWRYTALTEPFLNTPDVFNADPVSPSDVEGAKQNGLVLNNQVNTKMNKVAFIDEYVRAAVDEGTVIVKTGWDYQATTETRQFPVYEIQPATDTQQVQRLQLAAQQPVEALPEEMAQAVQLSNDTGVPHFPVQVAFEEVEVEVPLVNQPTWEVCHYANVYIDPSCNGDIDKAGFVIYSFESNRSQLEAQGIYKNLDHIGEGDVTSDGTHKSEWAGSGFQFEDKPRKKLVVYEYWGYWDIDNSGVTKPIVATWVGNVMIRLTENPYPDGKPPFVAVPFMPLKDNVHGEPDGELLIENQEIAGALTRGMVDIMGRSANAQTGVRKGSLDALNKRRFERGQDYEFNDVGDAQQSIYMHTFPEIPASAYNFLQMQSQEAESLTGVLAFNQGVTGAGLGSTAAAARGALSSAARRELGILRRLSEGMKKIGHKILAMNQVFLSEEEVVRVTESEFVTVNRDDLAGHYDIRLSISTAEADEQKAQELSFMLQTTAQSMGIEFTKMILAEIADLRKMPQLAEQLRNFQPQPDPIAQQQAQLELAKTQAETQKIAAETQKILAEAQLASYKAANTQADTDKKNLDYVEQEGGIAHARDLDKMEAQANAQAKTKVVEASLRALEGGDTATTTQSE